MQRAADALPAALRRLITPSQALDLCTALWPTLAGRAIAAHSRPIRLRDGVLVIAVDQPSWVATMESLLPQLKSALARWLGPDLITEIRLANAALPIHENAQPVPAPLADPVAPVSLPSLPDSPALDALHPDSISDPELRSLIASFTRAYFRNEPI